MLHFRQNVRANVWTHTLWGDQFHAASQYFLQQERELDEMVESLLTASEFHEDVDIALAGLLTPREGAEQPQAENAQGPDLILMPAEDTQDLLLRLHCRAYRFPRLAV